MTTEWSGDLVARWRAGDQQAATELFHRYADQLVALARSRLPARLASRVEPEDIVQSVYRVFFADARAGRYELQRGGDLWRLLVTITMHKVVNQVIHNKAQKRNVARERRLSGMGTDLDLELLAQGPSPVEAVALAEELEEVLRRLEPLERRVLELRLLGYNQAEIATQTQRTERTVRRVLERVTQQLQEHHGFA